MFRFQQIEYLWLLLLIPLLLLLYYGVGIKMKSLIKRIGHVQQVEKLMPYRKSSVKQRSLVLIFSALFFTILALANLQRSGKSDKITRKGMDVVIALDVSKSMLANDLQPSRLERAKLLILRMLDKISNNRVGLVLFAGNAYVSVPLTSDISAVKMNLADASPDYLPTQGTVLSEAIQMSARCFNPRDTKYKSIVLISDGEDHDEKALDEVKAAIEEGINIHTVGVGSPGGVPLFDPETNANKLDAEGQEVISKLNEKELMDIASEGNGIYTLLNQPDKAAERMADVINHSEQRIFEGNFFTDYKSYFPYFLLGGLLLFVLDFFLMDKRPVEYV